MEQHPSIHNGAHIGNRRAALDTAPRASILLTDQCLFELVKEARAVYAFCRDQWLAEVIVATLTESEQRPVIFFKIDDSCVDMVRVGNTEALTYIHSVLGVMGADAA